MRKRAGGFGHKGKGKSGPVYRGKCSELPTVRAQKTGNEQALGCKVYRLSRKKTDKKNADFEVDLRLTDFYGPVV